MSEILKSYNPVFQSGEYTHTLAKLRGMDAFDVREVVSKDETVRKFSLSIVAVILKQYVNICRDNGRISIPSYSAKHILPDRETYDAVIAALYELFRSVIDESPYSITGLLSVGHGPDGYVPEPGETARDAQTFAQPQVNAAKRHNLRPIAEATTTTDRFTGVWRAADSAGVEELDIGFAFNTHGHVAVDEATFASILERLYENPDRLDTRVTVGANCGSIEGIDKAASEYFRLTGEPLPFGYANNINIKDIRTIEESIRENGSATHPHAVSVKDFALVVLRHRFPTVSLCCGFCPDDLRKLKALVTSSA